MTDRDESSARRAASSKVNGELMLAQTLEACLRAEQREPGSSAGIIARQPAGARAELRRLVQLGTALEQSGAETQPSREFIAAARARLLYRITGEPAAPGAVNLTALAGTRHQSSRREYKWVVRGLIGAFAAVLATSATLTASASSLPGDALYGVKQAQEELSLRLAADDQARVLALLRRADARLDETARLLQLGRTSDAVQTAQRYDQSVERATSAFVVTLDFDNVSRSGPLDTKLEQQQARLALILQSAPEPARPDLHEAMATTERGRELLADPRPVQRALGLRQSARPISAAAAVPTTNAEAVPTRTPTQRPIVAAATVTPGAVIARAAEESLLAPDVSEEYDKVKREDRDEDDRQAVVVAQTNGSNSGRGNGRQLAPATPGNEGRGDGSDERDWDDRDDGASAVVSQATASGSQDEDRGGLENRSNGNGNRDDDERDEPVVARPSSVVPTAPAELRGGSGRSETSNSGNGNSGSTRQAPVQAGSSPVRGSDEDSRGSATTSSDRTTSAPTATPGSVRRGGDTPRPADDSHGNNSGDKKSGADD